MGSALPCSPDDTACLATVSYPQVEEFARHAQASFPLILATAFAHEIGHLLLGANSHSSHGVMRGDWYPGDFAPDASNPSMLLFEDGQVQLIQASVRERVRRKNRTSTAGR